MWYCAYHFAGLLFQMLSGFFLLNACDATRKAKALQAASAFKRRKFWGETHTLLWLLIRRIIFLTREKNIVCSSDGYNSFAYENLRHSFSVSISRYEYNKFSFSRNFVLRILSFACTTDLS